MAGFDPALFAAGGSTSLALAAVLWALSQRRIQADARSRLGADLSSLRAEADAFEAAADAFDSVLIAIRGQTTQVAGGSHGLAACARTQNAPLHCRRACCQCTLPFPVISSAAHTAPLPLGVLVKRSLGAW